jgi:predicted RNA methylase
MGWTLAILFAISALLLIFSILRTVQASNAEKKRIDLVHISLMKDIDNLKDSLRNIELETEVIMQEAGMQLSRKDVVFMREVLDLYKRNYSIASIAEKQQVSVEEIEQMLAPYLTSKDERRKAANEG